MRILFLVLITFCCKDISGGINRTDEFGRTLLHTIVMMQNDPLHITDRHDMDTYKAYLAASFILRGAGVCIKDKASETPILLAKKDKQNFPLTYKVIYAGFIKESYERRLPKPQNGQSYSSEEMSVIEKLFSPMDLWSWESSLDILKNFSQQSKL